MKHYAIHTPPHFYVINSKESAFQYLMRGIKVSVVERKDDISDIYSDKIVGKIGNDWWVLSDNQDIR